jgi:homoserine dehydrogenase
MLQGDAIREITMEGPGAGGIETASAVVADIAGVVGTMGSTGFLQNDSAWRALPALPRGEHRSPYYFRLSVEDRPGVLAHVAQLLAAREISVARLLQYQNGDGGAALHVVTHETRTGALDEALDAIEALPEVRRRPVPLPVISDRGVEELGWA